MKLRRVISHAFTFIMVVLFIAVFGSFITSKISGGEPGFYGYQLKSVLSGSMEPGIKTGSIIAIKPSSDTTSFQEGDVITFRESEGRLITHRVIEVVKHEVTGQVMYRTKGDNNDAPDLNAVLSTNVIGKYTGFTIPYAGYAASFAGSKTGNVTLLIVPGILLVLYAVFTLWRAISSLEETGKQPKETVSE